MLGFLRRKEVQDGPRIAGRFPLGSRFSIMNGETAVVGNDIVVTNLGVDGNKQLLDFKLKDAARRFELHTDADTHWRYEYRISLDPEKARQGVASLVIDRLSPAKPFEYNTEFWLKQGESAASEHGLIITNRSVSKSKQGEFTNVYLDLEYQGQKVPVTLTSFAKGKENFVYAQTKRSAGFKNFDIKLTATTESEATFSVKRTSDLMLE